MNKFFLSISFIFYAKNLAAIEEKKNFEQHRVTEFIFPEKNQTFQNYVGKERERSCKNCEILTDEDLKEAVWLLFDAFDNLATLEPNTENRILWNSSDKLDINTDFDTWLDNVLEPIKDLKTGTYEIAIDIIERINNKTILKKALDRAFELDKDSHLDFEGIYIKIIKKIKDDNILKDFFFKSIKQNKTLQIYPKLFHEIINNINNENILNETLNNVFEADKNGDIFFENITIQILTKVNNPIILKDIFLKALEHHKDTGFIPERVALAIVEKINDETILKEPLLKALDYENKGKALYPEIALEIVKKIKDETILKEALLKALNCDNNGEAQYPQIALEIVKKIKDETLLKEALLKALEPNNKMRIRSEDTAVKIVEKINDEKILKEALLKVLELGKRGKARSEDTAAKIIEKINDEKILKEGLFKALEPNDREYNIDYYLALKIIEKINDEKILKEGLFKALEPNNRDIIYCNVALKIIEKINDEIVLKEALLKALEQNDNGFARSPKAAVGIVKKINDEIVLKEALLKALEQNDDGFARSPKAAVAIVEKINDEIVLKEALLKAVNLNQRKVDGDPKIAFEIIKKISNTKNKQKKNQDIFQKAFLIAMKRIERLATYDDIALKIVTRINNEEFLKKYFLEILTLNNGSIDGLEKINVKIIKKIDDKELLKTALKKILKLDSDGKSFFYDQEVIAIIKKIDDECVTRDVLLFAKQELDLDTIYSDYVVKEIFSLRRGIHPVIEDAELITLYQGSRNESLRECIEHEVSESRIHLADQIGLNINLQGQEALFDDRKRALQEFEKVKNDLKWKNFFPETHDNANEKFKSNFETLQDFLLKKEDFKHKTAEMGLRLIGGDSSVPCYASCLPKDYAIVTRMDDPTKTTGLQMFVFLINICDQKKQKLQDQMMWNLFQEQFRQESLWNTFKYQAELDFKNEGITLRGNIADTVNDPKVGEAKFREVLELNLTLNCLKGVVSNLRKKQDDLFRKLILILLKCFSCFKEDITKS